MPFSASYDIFNTSDLKLTKLPLQYPWYRVCRCIVAQYDIMCRHVMLHLIGPLYES